MLCASVSDVVLSDGWYSHVLYNDGFDKIRIYRNLFAPFCKILLNADILFLELMFFGRFPL